MDHDPDRPSRLLEDVLARPEFGAPIDEQSSLLWRMLDTLAELWSRIPEWVDTVLMVVVVVGAVFLIVALLRGGVVSSRRSRSAVTGEEDDAATLREPASELYRRGIVAHDAGEHREAVVFLFRAMVNRLAEVGLLLDDPSRTNREHQRDLRRRRDESRAFADAVPPFERVRYGRRDATADDARVLREAARAVFTKGAT